MFNNLTISQTTTFINVLVYETIVLKMRTIINEHYWKILGLFYSNKNTPLHLREISRNIRLREGPLTRHLNQLLQDKILIFKKEGNLKKFNVLKSKIPQIFPAYDLERYEKLPYIRRNAITLYIHALKEKPIFIILFGSTAKGSFRDNSDIDLITVFNKKTDTKEARMYAEAQTSIRLSEFQLSYKEFTTELKLKQDNVIQAGIETGYPIHNQIFFYEVVNNG